MLMLKAILVAIVIVFIAFVAVMISYLIFWILLLANQMTGGPAPISMWQAIKEVCKKPKL
jgi:hypothetical protein